MARNAYYTVTESDSLAHNKLIERLLSIQLENIEGIVSLPFLSETTVAVGNEYIVYLRTKLQ